MSKEDTISLLQQNHNDFEAYLQQLNQDQLQMAPPQKWTALQQAQHIVQCLRPLAQGLLLPNFVLKMLYGKANRPSKTYQQLVDRYNEKLQLGGATTAPFVPKAVYAEQLPSILANIKKYNLQICHRSAKRSEAELDNVVAPHPLLGKVTLREMLYFTAYHVQHHQQLIERGLNYKM